MTTYADMQARIIDEVLGGVTTAQIQNAIQDAIKEYEHERFWFTEAVWAEQPLFDDKGQPLIDWSGNFITSQPLLTTIPKLEWYSIDDLNASTELGSVAHFDTLVIVAFNQRFRLTYRTPQWLDDVSVGPQWYSLPTDWTQVGQQLRFYPIPDAAYPIHFMGTQWFSPLVNGTDSNPWTIQGEILIRRRAKQMLYRSVLRNPDMAAAEEPEVQIALRALRSKTMKKGGRKQIRVSSYF